VTKLRVRRAAARQIDEIYRYARERWGEAQATNYIEGLFRRFDEIADRRTPWRQIPAHYEVVGYYARYEHHLIFWREMADGAIGVALILHERMDVAGRLRSAFEN